MAYKCSQCGHAAEEAGNCPTCNIPMIESKEEQSSEEQKSKEAA